MSTQTAALIQVVLEGVPLPATKAELVDYARSEDPDVARLLEALPDREYRSLDEVGEALAPVQPPRSQPEAAVPREESDAPPGGRELSSRGRVASGRGQDGCTGASSSPTSSSERYSRSGSDSSSCAASASSCLA